MRTCVSTLFSFCVCVSLCIYYDVKREYESDADTGATGAGDDDAAVAAAAICCCNVCATKVAQLCTKF